MATKHIQFVITILSISALSFSQSKAIAAGINCDHASSPSENMICSSDDLKKLDLKLSTIYSKLTKASNNKSNLQEKQKDWLIQRDKCASTSCLSEIYTNRAAVLSSQLRSLLAYKPDKIDMQALAELKHAIENRMQSNTEFPLENIIESFEVKDGITTFSNLADGDEGQHFPSKRPKGVSEDEWKALVKSKIEGGGENGSASYTLLDINGDGKRDLIIDSYIGGTGLFNYISALPRKSDSFSGKYVAENSDDFYEGTDDAGALYSINGRGSNQSANWVKLNGRIYAAFRNSYYGVDNLFLLRPFSINDKSPKIAVQYQYTLAISKQQVKYDQHEKPHEFTLDATTHTALMKALRLAGKLQASNGVSQKPICPPPSNLSEDESYAYSSYGPGHYSYEIVVDMPIWIDKTCYIGRLTDWFGGYDKKNGLFAQLWMKKPNEQENEASYDVVGKRKAVKINTSIDKFDPGG